ncbi:hypothetical protein Bbelb_135380 [Branchiostoma belcheri]|nr:hypothetical protein Bbelb_135380 [Branchiostoma belcheri]
MSARSCTVEKSAGWVDPTVIGCPIAVITSSAEPIANKQAAFYKREIIKGNSPVSQVPVAYGWNHKAAVPRRLQNPTVTNFMSPASILPYVPVGKNNPVTIYCSHEWDDEEHKHALFTHPGTPYFCSPVLRCSPTAAIIVRRPPKLNNKSCPNMATNRKKKYRASKRDVEENYTEGPEREGTDSGHSPGRSCR